MPHDVFISYASQDKPIADAVCNGLESAKIRCWIAPRDILPSQEWAAAIIEALDSARVLVVVFSAACNESRHVHREVERAVSKGLSVVPLRIQDTHPSKTLEYFLSTPHWLDALTPPLESRIAELAATLRLLLDRSEIIARPAQVGDPKQRKFVEVPPNQWTQRSGLLGWLQRILEDRS